MSYLVLARKYRPRRFEDMVGQEVVTGVLRGAIDEGRIGHAYLFAGPRGTGKTTTARILAKALNCVQGPTPDPCGECERCVASDEGTELDVIEIDAASNTSVNDVRELRDQVNYAPVGARFKVYIVDEVHMLSRAAFNALLKTLEEPPAHVKFLFATTELHKVPDTILSRCQVLRLSPIREEAIVARLEQVFAAEQVEAEAGVAAELARRARGGMRDALSLGDQLLALAGSAPKLADLSRLAGGAGLDELLGLIDAVLAPDRAALIDAVARWNGRESELAGALLDALRSCLVAATCGAASPHLEGGERAVQAFLERAKAIGSERLELMLGDLLRARERMRLLPGSERVVLEVALLELSRPELALPLSDLEQRLVDLEQRLASGSPPPPRAAEPPPTRAPAAAAADPPSPSRAASPPPRSTPAPAPASPAPATSSPATSNPAASSSASSSAGSPSPGGPEEVWPRLLASLSERHASIADVLRREGRLEKTPGGARIRFGKLTNDDARLVADKRNRRAVERALSTVIGREIALEMGAEASPPPAPVEELPPDAFTTKVADLFEGRVEDS
ncbi:MAG: DNA polymerase III subunit gamma/tau [Planctomycetota bacterium]